jgi:hypothetical protein
MKKPAKKDSKAPKMMTVCFSAEKEWGKIIGQLRQFNTGGIGYNFSGRIQNPKNGESYMVSANLILIGSTPKKAKKNGK